MRIAGASIGVGLVVLALKAAAWLVTGSAAFYSDALETVVNVAASGIAFGALRFAAMPADHNHPYGHDKAEFVAAVIEGVLIVVAAVSILQHAWGAWRHPHVFTAPALGAVLNLAATVVNAGWAGVLFRAARQVRSPALRGDARHLMGDVVTSCGVLAGVGLVLLTGILRLDAAIGAATAVYVLWSGVHLIGESMGGLMDMAPDDGTVERNRTRAGGPMAPAPSRCTTSAPARPAAQPSCSSTWWFRARCRLMRHTRSATGSREHCSRT